MDSLVALDLTLFEAPSAVTAKCAMLLSGAPGLLPAFIPLGLAPAPATAPRAAPASWQGADARAVAVTTESDARAGRVVRGGDHAASLASGSAEEGKSDNPGDDARL